MDITVAIPTYNGGDRIPFVLAALQNQQHQPQLNWEILVVDNNSTDRTSQIVHDYQSRLPRLRLCQETQQGAGYARQRAFRSAAGEIVAFLDDDTIPEPDWVQQVYEFAQAYPQAGAYGSRVRGRFDGELPPNFERIAPFFALTDRGDRPKIYEKSSRLLPPSAGLAVRKLVWQTTVPERMILTGRTKTSMLTGEDLEMLAHIQASPWQIWYNPAMQIHHQIETWRLTPAYLRPFFRGIGLSRYVTRMIGRPWAAKIALTVAYLGSDLVKILRHLLRYRQSLKNNLVAVCELELFWGSLISPFYLGYLGLRLGRRLPVQSGGERS
jgi:glycosyltransferase involved in cell wall biosynthesis